MSVYWSVDSFLDADLEDVFIFVSREKWQHFFMMKGKRIFLIVCLEVLTRCSFALFIESEFSLFVCSFGDFQMKDCLIMCGYHSFLGVMTTLLNRTPVFLP